MLISRGFQDVALDDVARKAGVAKGTLFLYYKSKDDLFSAAFADLVEQLAERLDQVLQSPLPGRALLEETARVILEHFDANKDFIAQFTVARLPGCGDKSSGKLLKRMLANLDRVGQVIRRCAREGLIETKDHDAAAAALFGLCRSAILYNHMRKISSPLTERREQVISLFLNGVGK